MSFGGKKVEIPRLAGLPPLHLVHRADLHRALHDVAAARGIRVEHGRRLVSAEQGATGALMPLLMRTVMRPEKNAGPVQRYRIDWDAPADSDGVTAPA
nr:hypothetical protein GCM10020093_102680 [Planobispora longispora]